MTPDPHLDATLVTEFKTRLARARSEQPEAWDASSRLVGQREFPETLARLCAAVRAAALAQPLRETLLEGLRGGTAERVQDLKADRLKQLTGLPATKALRSLCLLFGLADPPEAAAEKDALAPSEVEAFLLAHRNPFDLLLHATAPSLLDIGTGDLTFAEEVAAHYLAPLQAQGKPLTLHCLDRIDPGSKLAGPLQADPARLARLRGATTDRLNFRYWGNQDCFDLRRLKQLLPRYTIATCNAPPTPTVAFEPTRLAPALVARHLRETKGASRLVRVDGEAALEVIHQGRSLLFPPWKFDIRGPLALLEVLAQRGSVGILASVDNEVFWELLAQLTEEEQYRPKDVLFTQASLPEVFGPLYEPLSALPVGRSLDLSSLTNLRREFPRRDMQGQGPAAPYRFRHVEIRRGATFGGLPAGRTATLFKDMKDETTPWHLVLVPEQIAGSSVRIGAKIDGPGGLC
jgi:hypothetical protein